MDTIQGPEFFSLYNFGSHRRENTASNSSSVASLLSLCFCMCILLIVFYAVRVVSGKYAIISSQNFLFFFSINLKCIS
jgi:hypothetical protein